MAKFSKVFVFTRYDLSTSSSMSNIGVAKSVGNSGKKQISYWVLRLRDSGLSTWAPGEGRVASPLTGVVMPRVYHTDSF